MKKINLDLPATKRDLQKAVVKLATKEELKKLATKEELEKLATKKELKGVEQALRIEIRLANQETKEEIKKEITQSKSQMLDVLDKFLGELDTSRDERAIDAEQKSRDRKKLENHGRRIKNLEQRVFAAA